MSEHIQLLDTYSKITPGIFTFHLQPIVPGATTVLKNIFFETDSWQLKEESKTQLDDMARFMQQNPEVMMEVAGHTDQIGTASYNLELSRKRAEAVADELKKRNIPSYRLRSVGLGFSMPVGDNNSEEGRRANRRTEFVIREIK